MSRFAVQDRRPILSDGTVVDGDGNRVVWLQNGEVIYDYELTVPVPGRGYKLEAESTDHDAVIQVQREDGTVVTRLKNGEVVGP